MSDEPSLPFFYGEESADLLVVNPLPGEREVRGPLSPQALWPRGERGDPTASRHSLDRDAGSHPVAPATGDDWEHLPVSRCVLPATSVPGYGYAAVAREDVATVESPEFDERATVETDRYRLTFDRDHGGLAAWHDGALGREWVDGSIPWSLGSPVHERPADEESGRASLHRLADPDPLSMTGAVASERGFQPDWHAARRGATAVTRHRVYDVPGGYEVRQRLEVPGLGSDVELAFSIPASGATVTVEAVWTMRTTTRPEATYVPLPVDLDDPTARIDVGGQPVAVDDDQLPGTCRDYYTAQRWVDVSDDAGGMTVGCPLNPLVQFGEFSFARNARSVDLDRGLVLGWVTNNYWDTNFRASQPGLVRARYHLTPHGGFDEARAHRLGLAAEHDAPLVHPLDTNCAASAVTPERLLDLPEPPVLVLQLRPTAGTTGAFHRLPPDPASAEAENGPLFAVLYNASDESATATVDSGLVSLVAAESAGLLGEPAPESSLEVVDGSLRLELASRETQAVRLSCTSPGTE